jgi:hypothetical protein
MAKARPTLGVTAQPVSTFIQPNQNAVAAELYDQQTVQNALQFAEAFSNLSVSAARLAGGLKQEWNEEQVQQGMDLVNKSRKSYQQLVQSGEIKPTENPWFAIGAQKASGSIEAMKARVHFESLLEQKVAEDPSFLDDPRGFDAFAYQYTQNVNQFMGDASYMSRAFYESFNPFMGTMQAKHEGRVIEHNTQKILTGVASEVQRAAQDWASPNPTVSQQALGTLQTRLDEMVNQGVASNRVNNAAVDALVDLMATSDNPRAAREMFDGLFSGTGPLSGTPYAKTQMALNASKIQANDLRMSAEESKFLAARIEEDLTPQIVSGAITVKQAEEALREDFAQGKVRINANEQESKIGYLRSYSAAAIREREVQVKKEQNNAFWELVTLAADTDGVEDLDARLGELKERVGAIGLDPEQLYRGRELLDRITEQAKKDRMLATADAQTNELYQLALDAKNAQSDEEASAALKKYKDRIETLGLTPEQRFKAEEMFAKVQDDTFEAQSIRNINHATTILWNGTGNNDGILPTLAREVSDSFKPNSNFVPGFAEARQQYDTYLKQTLGLTDPNDTKYKKGLSQAYTKMRDALKQYEAAYLQGAGADREAAASVRQRFLAMRMNLATQFDDARDVADAYKGFLSEMNPQVVEKAESLPYTEDMVMAYMLAKDNNQNLSKILPGGENGKALIAQLDRAVTLIRKGEKIGDVARDLSRMMSFGGASSIDYFDTANPIKWTDIDAPDQQTKENIQASYQELREEVAATSRSGAFEPDAGTYLDFVYRQAYAEEVNTNPMGARSAHKVAMDKVREENVFIRGSLLPKRNLSPNQDEVYLEAWLRANYPDNPNATLIVVSPPGADQVLMAVRENGKAVSSGLIRAQDIKMTDALFAQTVDEMLRGKNAPKLPPLLIETRGHRSPLPEWLDVWLYGENGILMP